MLNLKTELHKMIKFFPSWTDIRKRTDKSVGGALIKSYADESKDINTAIEEYQKEFFLLCYFNKEEDIPAYVYVGLIGNNAVKNIQISILDNQDNLTDNVDDFFNNLSTKILYQDYSIIIHPSFFNNYKEIPENIEYIVRDKYIYKTNIYYQHIWNIFDEFALYSGLKRYDLETNTELANRILQHYKNFPNSSEQGLKNAIKNALYNFEDIDDGLIKMERPNASNLSLDNIYDDISNYNKDLFRTKKWDTSLWEHNFKKSELIAHPWDIQPNEYQDGVGNNLDLHTDFICNLNAKDSTDLKVTGYKKSRRAISNYIRNNNIETDINLTLTKYENEITPKEIQYKITASDVEKINASNIFINGYCECIGQNDYYIQDLFDSSENIKEVKTNILKPRKQYQLTFSPTSNYSNMQISKLNWTHDSICESLLKENDKYVFKDNVLTNKNILIHASSTSDMLDFSNLKNVDRGFSLDSAAEKGIATFFVDNTMSYGIINTDTECQEVNITDNPLLVSYSGFNIDKSGKLLTASGTDSSSNIVIHITKCRSYSFEFEDANIAYMQGAITVTVEKDGIQTSKIIYSQGKLISEQFNKSYDVKITIQKTGLNPVAIKNIRCARYDITYRMDNNTVVSNSMYTMLPKIKDTDRLHLDIITYTAYAPIVKSVHVGNSLNGAKYTVNIDTSSYTSDTYLDIESTCIVTLENITDSTKIKNYCTKSYYTNTTSSIGYICLDISNFTNINSSTPLIQHKYKGLSKDYITIQPGDTIQTISINGKYLKSVYSRSIASLLYNNKPDYEVYVSRAVNDFIVKNGNNTRLVSINKKDLAGSIATNYSISGDINSLTAVFVIDKEKDNIYISSNIDRDFQTICLYPISNKTYVAYNTIYSIKQVQSNIKLINTFNPILSFTKNYLYMLSDIRTTSNDSCSVKFVHSNGDKTNWSLGANTPLEVSTDLEFSNKETYELTVSHINDKYILANEIDLNKEYVINGEVQELAEFIITPPDGIVVNTENYEITEEQYIEEDGFNKLKYSNVYRILSITLVASNTLLQENIDYTYLAEEGIVIWNKDSYSGLKITIKYIIQSPVSVSFSNEDLLYKKVGYHIEAYDKLPDENIFTDLFENDVVFPKFKTSPDKLITTLSNDKFDTLVNENDMSIRILQRAESNKIAVHNGYVYDNGLEYYFFCDRFEDETSRIGNIEMINTSKLGDKLLFRIRSTNYLPFSNMSTNTLAKLSSFDFSKKRFDNISEFYHLTSCDTYNNWYTFNMDTKITDGGLNEYATYFAPKDENIPSYAVFDITNYVKQGNIISIYKTGKAKVSIAKETKIKDMLLAKSLLIEDSNIITMERVPDTNIYYYIVDKEIEPETRYHILVQNGEAIIDDISNMKYTSIDTMVSSHMKNIKRLGLNIAEKLMPNSEIDLEFDKTGAQYNDLEISSDGNVISTALTISYGLTKINDINLSKCVYTYLDYKKNYFISTEDNASLETPYVGIRLKNNISELVIKINDIITDSMKSFNIKVLGCNTATGIYTEVKHVQNNNIITVPKRSIKNYMKVALTDIAKSKVINSITLYAQYTESNDDTNTLATRAFDTGNLITKIYDIGSEEDILLKNIEYESNKSNNILFYYRGCRENKREFVFTDWYMFNKEKPEYNHVLSNYRYIQFKIYINNPDATVSVKKFTMEVK